MYGWIWRKLPFGLPGKIIGSLLLIGIAVYLLWYHVFPAAEPLLPFDDVQVENPGGPNQPGDSDLVSPEPSGDSESGGDSDSGGDSESGGDSDSGGSQGDDTVGG